MSSPSSRYKVDAVAPELTEKIKKIMFVCSTFVFLGGAAVLASSLWTAVTIIAFSEVLTYGSGIFAAVYIMIVVGSAMFIGSFFGCAATALQSRSMIVVYALVLATLFLMQVIGSVLVFVYYPIAKDEAQNSIRDYTTDTKIMDGWDTVQGVLKCCGMNDHKDWKPSGTYPNLPFSCCADKIDQCSDTQTTLYSEGCDEKLFQFFNIIGSIGFSILIFEVLALAAAGVAIGQLS